MPSRASGPGQGVPVRGRSRRDGSKSAYATSGSDVSTSTLAVAGCAPIRGRGSSRPRIARRPSEARTARRRRRRRCAPSRAGCGRSPTGQRPLLALDEERALAGEHEEVLLRGLGVVEAVRLSRREDVDPNAVLAEPVVTALERALGAGGTLRPPPTSATGRRARRRRTSLRSRAAGLSPRRSTSLGGPRRESTHPCDPTGWGMDEGLVLLVIGATLAASALAALAAGGPVCPFWSRSWCSACSSAPTARAASSSTTPSWRARSGSSAWPSSRSRAAADVLAPPARGRRTGRGPEHARRGRHSRCSSGSPRKPCSTSRGSSRSSSEQSSVDGRRSGVRHAPVHAHSSTPRANARGRVGGNDPMAIALTLGLIAWIESPDTRDRELALLVVRQLALGLLVGVALVGRPPGSSRACRARSDRSHPSRRLRRWGSRSGWRT